MSGIGAVEGGGGSRSNSPVQRSEDVRAEQSSSSVVTQEITGVSTHPVSNAGGGSAISEKAAAEGAVREVTSGGSADD